MGRVIGWGVLGCAVVAGCAPASKPECLDAEQIDAWADGDGDGYGAGVPERVCAPAEGQADNGLDCDDADPAVHPGGVEACNGRDDDCDGDLDDGFALRTWYTDDDGDGYGVRYPAQRSCAEPGAGWADNQDDCDDADPDRHPGAVERCSGLDEDCDGRIDDADPDLPAAELSTFYRDVDADGFGDPAAPLDRCDRPAGYVDDDTDCHDGASTVNPDAEEVPGDGIDQNCNALEACYLDADGDEARAETWIEVADPDCTVDGVVPADAPIDCDDANPDVNVTVDWREDPDGDGYGSGPVVTESCLNPGGGLAPGDRGLDCDEDDPDVNPGALDPCNDGFDTDCDQSDSCTTCLSWRDSLADAPDGVYQIEPTPGELFDVWCDMTTDGGGWTLVAATTGVTLDDAAGGWHGELTTLSPSGSHPAVWSGLRGVVGQAHDMRFACKMSPNDPAMTVDLSFHGVPWYTIVTTGTEQQSCFNELDGQGQTPAVPPHRRDNVTGTERPSGDQWNAGYLEGEDSCGDNGDFTVDFDDRGMDSNQTDGTDWGEDDGSMKCGFSSPISGSWFVFVRE